MCDTWHYLPNLTAPRDLMGTTSSYFRSTFSNIGLNQLSEWGFSWFSNGHTSLVVNSTALYLVNVVQISIWELASWQVSSGFFNSVREMLVEYRKICCRCFLTYPSKFVFQNHGIICSYKPKAQEVPFFKLLWHLQFSSWCIIFSGVCYKILFIFMESS